MNAPPPYLRVGPVAIHIRSRETDYEPTSFSSDYPSAEPTLDVQGSVFLSPDDGTSIQVLNGVVPSNTVNTPPPSFPPPVLSPSPPPPSVASAPYPPISSSVANADYFSVSSPAPAPSGLTSVTPIWSPGPQASPAPTPSPTFLQETKDYSSTPAIASTSVLASSPPSGANPRPTVLAGSMTAILSDPSLVESMDATPTSSLGATSPTIASENSTTSKNTMPIIVGSVLAAILGVVLIVAVITWFLRVRSRRRSEDEPSWDPEPNSGHIHDSDSFFDSPPYRVGQDRIAPPARPRPPGPTTRLRFVEPQTMRVPYSGLATPELAHTTGPLTVTNFVPGDVLLSANTSIFMGSRPGSTPATPQIDNSTPRFTRLQDGGLPVPWSHGAPEPTKGPISRPRAWPSRLSAASLKKVFSSSPPKSAQIDPLQPRASAANIRTHFKGTGNNDIQFSEPARTADQTWSGSIRTGITNALSAVMGTAARPQESPDGNLTPIRPRPNRRLSSKTGVSTLDSMSTTSVPSTAIGYTMEETSEGHGIVHIHSLGRPREMLPSNETIKEEEIEHESETDSSSLPGSSTLGRFPANGVVIEHAIPRMPDDVVGRPSSVPRLPTIRPLSRAWTLRSEGFVTLPESDDGYRSAFNQMINERKKEYDRHLAELEAVATEEASRPTISRASTSLMTESTNLSRESSVMMDEEERKAKKVLRMRRKRAMALSATGVGNGKIYGRGRA